MRHSVRHAAAVVLSLVLAPGVLLGQSHELSLDEALERPAVRDGLERIADARDRAAERLARIGGIRAPSGDERERAEAVRHVMDSIGLEGPRVDRVNNAIGTIPGEGDSVVAFISTLDDLATVAQHQKAADGPPRVEGDRVVGPGANTSSTTVAMLTAAEALLHQEIRPRHTLVFAAVAQEETGLLGMRTVYEAYRDRAVAFVDILGEGSRISHGALGIHWWRIEATGPGGHTLGGGLPNVNQGIGRAVDRILRLPHPEEHADRETRVNVSILESGTVFNHKPERGWFSLDLRSLDGEILDAMEQAVDSVLTEVSAETGIDFQREPESLIPGGQIDGLVDSDLVRTSMSIARHLGLDPTLNPAGSSNMNVAIGGGTPAIGLGGDRGGKRGRPGEWADIPAMMRTAEHVFLLAVTMGGMDAPRPKSPNGGAPAHREPLSQEVEIRRTTGGIPHVLAESYRAAGFGLGWVQMEDYGIEVVDRLLRARGATARHYGPDDGNVEADARAKRGLERARETFSRLPDDVRHVYEGFARAVNRFLELHPDDAPPSLRPDFTGQDVLARDVTSPGWAAADRFVSRLHRERGEARGEGAGEGGPPPATSDSADPSPDAHPRRVDGEPGSNTWALAPERTTSGHAILMRNPHLSWTAGYYEAHLTVPGELDFYGDFRIGGPFTTVGGWNDRLGWSTTNNNPQVDDIYLLVEDPARRDHVLFDGGSVPLERAEVTVEVLMPGGVEEVVVERWESPLGPVIHRAPGSVYVLRSGGDLGYRSGEQLLRKMQARSLEEWREAMRIPGRPRSNISYADADGNIFYVWNALHPVRPHPHGGDSIPIPARGWDDVWREYVPFDELPQLLNPEGGYVRNENDPFHHTNLHHVFDPRDFPDEFPEPRLRLRSQHSLELLHNDERFSLEDVVDLKHSKRMLLAERVLPDLLDAARAEVTDGNGGLAEAVAVLEGWDGTTARDARGAVLFVEWWDHYLEGARGAPATPASAGFPAPPDDLFRESWTFDAPLDTPRGLADPARAVEALETAVASADARWGALDVPWGDVHRARHGRLDLPAGGCHGVLGCFRLFWFADDHDMRRRATGGDGWVSAVEFGEIPRAYTILAYGQSARPGSPHHEDQLRDFVERRMTPVAFTEEAIEDALLARYRPGEEKRWTGAPAPTGGPDAERR